MRTLAVLLLLVSACKRTEPPVPETAPAPASPFVADPEDATGSGSWRITGGPPVPAEAARLLDEGRAAGGRGDYATAVTTLMKAHDAAPSWPAPLYELAYTYELMDQPAKAQPLYEQVVALAPRGFFTALTSLDCLRREAAKEWRAGTCKAYAMTEFLEPAKRPAALQALVAAAPTLAPAWKELALVTADPAKRLELLEHALASRPDPETRGFALVNKAVVLASTGKGEEGTKLLGEVALDPASPLDVVEVAKASLAQLRSSR